MRTRKDDPAERPDEDNPELTRAELRKSRPAREVLPELIGEKAAEELLRAKGSKATGPRKAAADNPGKRER